MKLTAIRILGLCLFAFGCSKPHPTVRLSSEALQQARLDWDVKTLVTAYQNAGNSEAAWDGPATRALTEFARTRAGVTDPIEPWSQIIATNCSAAIEAGCDDPMVRYLYIKFSMNQTNTPRVFLDAFIKDQKDMQNSDYPPVRKFYASLRAFQQFSYTYGYGTNVDYTLGFQMMNDAMSDLVAMLTDKTTPPEEVYEAGNEYLYVLPGNIQQFHNYYDPIEGPLFANWPDESTSWLLKAKAYHLLAQIYRGSGYSDSVTKEGWKGFNDNLALEEKALNRAWELNSTDPRTAVEGIYLELGQGKGRDRMEQWFNRAMENDPEDYDACSAKLTYLEPKWYGSTAEMLEFGRECVQNTNWSGTVPLILVDAHYNICNEYTDASERTNYWKQPDVWADINSSYERYLQDNPDDSSRIAYYARYAYYAEQWDKLNELAPKVSPNFYYLFGGADQFEQIAQLARDHAGQH
jgi:hypothetical protein